MSKKESDSIAIIRAIATIYVCLGNHYIPLYFPGSISTIISQAFGFIGVGAFFAISGFIFGCKAKTDSSIGTWKWIKKRLYRILVPYWCVVVSIIILRIVNQKSLYGISIIAYILNLHGILQLKNGYAELVHTWFVSIIMLAYFIILFWKNFQANKNKEILIGVFGITGIIISSGLNQITSAMYGANILLFYIMFEYGYHRCTEKNAKQSNGKELYIFALVLVGCLGVRMLGKYYLENSIIYTMIAAFMGIISAICYFKLVCICTEYFPRLGEGVICKWIGKLSYEFYLVHALLFSGVCSIYGTITNSKIEIIVLVFVAVVLAYLLNYISCWIFLKLKKFS